MTVISIRKAGETWVVRADGAVIAESRDALELSEGALPFVIYFPRKDIAMAFLDENDHRTTCPHKGEARYFDVVTGSRTLTNAGWSYENPPEDVAAIKDHIAFFATDLVAVEQL